MRLLVGDIDDLAVTPADLADMAFAGSPAAVRVTVDGGEPADVTPVRSASLDRPTGDLPRDERYDLSKALEPPCDATVTWPDGMATLHVVSYHYCTLDDVLEFGDEKRQSPRQLGRTEAQAFGARNRAEAVCESICRRTFRAAHRSQEAPDARGFQLDWPASRLLTGTWRLVGDGAVRREYVSACGWGWSGGSEVEYVTGEDRGTPADVRWAVAKLAAYYLSASKVPDRAVYESTEAGMTRYTLASETSTGLPDVDAILARHARRRWAIP